LGVVTFQKFPKVPVENFVRKHPVTMLRFPQKIKKNGAANKWGNIAGVLGDFLRGIEVGDPNGGWGGARPVRKKGWWSQAQPGLFEAHRKCSKLRGGHGRKLQNNTGE